MSELNLLHTLDNSVAEKYLADKIHLDGTTVSITETINSRLLIAKAKSEEILKICNDPRLIGIPSTIKGGLYKISLN